MRGANVKPSLGRRLGLGLRGWYRWAWQRRREYATQQASRIDPGSFSDAPHARSKGGEDKGSWIARVFFCEPLGRCRKRVDHVAQSLCVALMHPRSIQREAPLIEREDDVAESWGLAGAGHRGSVTGWGFRSARCSAKPIACELCR
jgi:hypothetical protein